MLLGNTFCRPSSSECGVARRFEDCFLSFLQAKQNLHHLRKHIFHFAWHRANCNSQYMLRYLTAHIFFPSVHFESDKNHQTFDNETENGKLYISYPMCEALRDIQKSTCKSSYRCLLDIADISKYKKLSATYSKFTSVKKYTVETWEMIIAIFLIRCQCLFHVGDTDHAYHWYKQCVTTANIFENEQILIHESRKVFVLSAFPEFLVDYFKEEFWGKLDEFLSTVSYEICPIEK